jgi:enhancing lycopene biosynthesis protein 2
MNANANSLGWICIAIAVLMTVVFLIIEDKISNPVFDIWLIMRIGKKQLNIPIKIIMKTKSIILTPYFFQQCNLT